MSSLGDKLKERDVWSFLALLLQGDSLLGLGPRGCFLRLGPPWGPFLDPTVSLGLTFFSLTAATSGRFRNCSGFAFFSPGSASEKNGHNQRISRVEREERVYSQGFESAEPVLYALLSSSVQQQR